jgi:hypothetical protein
LKNLNKKNKKSHHLQPPQILKPIADVANQGDYDLLLIGLENLFLKVYPGKVIGLPPQNLLILIV